MKIGLLITSIGNFGKNGFYNAQEVGLAKALHNYFSEVIIYKLVAKNDKASSEEVSGYPGVILNIIPAKNIGINGLLNTSVLDTLLDVMIYFSDTQIILPKVYQWAQRNHIRFFPYIGVLESHSTNRLKKQVINILFRRNLRIYRKCHCLAKTPTVEQKLKELGVRQTSVTPVGLDLTLLHQNMENVSVQDLKSKYGYQMDEKVILFVGRLIEEKQPIRMLEIFAQVYKIDANYRLLIVGQGPLQPIVDAAIQRLRLNSCIKHITQIPNNNIWELYRMANCFVNLNQQEIFGMAILEAMYYGSKVIAWEAPGPSLIIENGISGYLVNSNQKACDKILNSEYYPEKAKQRVLDHFTWDNMAIYIFSLVRE